MVEWLGAWVWSQVNWIGNLTLRLTNSVNLFGQAIYLSMLWFPLLQNGGNWFFQPSEIFPTFWNFTCKEWELGLVYKHSLAVIFLPLHHQLAELSGEERETQRGHTPTHPCPHGGRFAHTYKRWSYAAKSLITHISTHLGSISILYRRTYS